MKVTLLAESPSVTPLLQNRLLKDVIAGVWIMLGLIAIGIPLRFAARWGAFLRSFDGLRLDEWTWVIAVGGAIFAILASRSWRQALQIADRLNAMYQASRVATTAIDPVEIARHVVATGDELLPGCRLAVLTVQGDRLVPIAWAGTAERPAEIPVREEITVLGSGGPASQIAHPVFVENQMVAMVTAETDDGRNFSRDDLALLKGLISHLEMSLRSTMKYDRTRRQLVRDGLTNVFNHGYFQERLREEVVRASRYRSPLALIKVELDDFKASNETFGHAEGDRILQGVARVIRSGIRQTDLPARFSGDEFTILMPETSRKEAEVAAERIRRDLAEGRFLEIDGVPVRVTASLGVAGFPADAGDAATLLQQVDEAVREAKRAGKNRVCTAVPSGAQVAS